MLIKDSGDLHKAPIGQVPGAMRPGPLVFKPRALGPKGAQATGTRPEAGARILASKSSTRAKAFAVGRVIVMLITSSGMLG